MNSTNRKSLNIRPPQQQQGAVLIVSLVMLLIVTLIAVSSMQGTVLEEKMAGNTRDRNLAFQTAESSLREAETYVDGLVSMGTFNGSSGLFGMPHDEPDYTNSETWSDTVNHVVGDAPHGSYEAPRYFIKHYTTVRGSSGALNMTGYGDNKGTGDITVFKVTARSTGASADSAEVILRSYYGRTF